MSNCIDFLKITFSYNFITKNINLGDSLVENNAKSYLKTNIKNLWEPIKQRSMRNTKLNEDKIHYK